MPPCAGPSSLPLRYGEDMDYDCLKALERGQTAAPSNGRCWGDAGNGVQIGWWLAQKAEQRRCWFRGWCVCGGPVERGCGEPCSGCRTERSRFWRTPPHSATHTRTLSLTHTVTHAHRADVTRGYSCFPGGSCSCPSCAMSDLVSQAGGCGARPSCGVSWGCCPEASLKWHRCAQSKQPHWYWYSYRCRIVFQ